MDKFIKLTKNLAILLSTVIIAGSNLSGVAFANDMDSHIPDSHAFDTKAIICTCGSNMTTSVSKSIWDLVANVAPVSCKQGFASCRGDRKYVQTTTTTHKCTNSRCGRVSSSETYDFKWVCM